jgi:hypothetical protein
VILISKLCLGSCWVNKSRYEARCSIRYSIQYQIRIRITEPELSLDNRTQSPDLNQKESRSLDTKVELKSIRLRTKILNQFQDHLLKKDQFVDDLFNIFIIYRINQEPKSGSVVCVRWVRTNPDFSVNISVQITGNEVFNFVSNIRHLED